jgi:hypothetical protein
MPAAPTKRAGPPAPAVAAPKAGRVPKVAKTAAVTPVVEAAKAAKPPKAKLVRDSFTMPKDEYQVLDVLKVRAIGLEQYVKKSELLRAGIRALDAMSDRAFLKALDAVPTLKTGRPKAD